MTFSVQEIPFSYHLSWLNLSPIVAEKRIEQDVHLVTHQSGFHPILRLTPEVDGRRVDTQVQADPTRLSWQHEVGHIHAAFETIDTIRVRGQGLSIRILSAAAALTPFAGSYFFVDPVDQGLIYTSYESGRRYRITTLAGQLAVLGDQALGTADRGALVTPDETGQWEIVIEEFEASRSPYTLRYSFSDVTAAVAGRFDEFVTAIAPWRSARTPAAGLAAYVVWSATVGPAGFLQRPGVLMSKHWMDKVWSWDHCFNALALAQGQPELALDQFLTPFDYQDEQGALPDSVTHSEVLYNFVKPPIHGWALQGLRQRLPKDLDPVDLEGIYQRLSNWTRFWLDARRAPGHSLAHYQHGNDSGWDNSTVFDQARVIETADLAAFLAQQLHVLAELAAELDLTADAQHWASLSEKMQQAMLDELWNGKGFAAKDPRTGELFRTHSLLNLLPIVLGDRLPRKVTERIADLVRRHLTEWGLATEPPSSDHYRPDGYWRGPIWAPSTLLVENGLRRAGHTDLADDISDRFRRLCERSGFAENFDALTGAGLRDRAYTWTASAYLVLAAEHEARTYLNRSDAVENGA